MVPSCSQCGQPTAAEGEGGGAGEWEMERGGEHGTAESGQHWTIVLQVFFVDANVLGLPYRLHTECRQHTTYTMHTHMYSVR